MKKDIVSKTLKGIKYTLTEERANDKSVTNTLILQSKSGCLITPFSDKIEIPFSKEIASWIMNSVRENEGSFLVGKKLKKWQEENKVSRKNFWCDAYNNYPQWEKLFTVGEKKVYVLLYLGFYDTGPLSGSISLYMEDEEADGDGIQGTKLTPKVNVEHSYILTTSPPTEFCLQPFFLKHLDESKHNYFKEFDNQAHEVNVRGSLPNHLYLIDPYMVHRTPKITESCDRLFLRITYAFTELQHPKNTKNPHFGGQEFEKRIDIRENLCENEFPVPYHLYGLS